MACFYFVIIFCIVNLNVTVKPQCILDECTCVLFDASADFSGKNLSSVPKLENIKCLNLSRNNFIGIPAELKNFLNLSFLDLSGNHKIKFIEFEYEIKSLKILKINNCSIKTFSNVIFNKFANIEILKLSNNQIITVNSSLISNTLKELYLDNNHIKYINYQAIEKLFALTSLIVSNNRHLTSFLGHSKSLTYLDISNCALENPPSGLFPKLKYLNLHNNNIYKLNIHSFLYLPSLELLNISLNAIKSLDKNCFKHLHFLKVLDLAYNRLVYIDPETFNHNNLTELYISHNYFKTIENFFSKTLKVLDIGYCEIEYIDKVRINSHLPFLQKLILTRNRLSSIPDNLESSHLTYLDLSYNHLTSISNKSFIFLKSLKSLFLNGNKLTYITPEHFLQVTNIVLEQNPWNCDCTYIRHLYKWLIYGEKIENDNKLFCQSPKMFEGLTWNKACEEFNASHLYYFWGTCTIFFIFILLTIYRINKRKVDETVDEETNNRTESETLEQPNFQLLIDRRELNDFTEHENPPSYLEAINLPPPRSRTYKHNTRKKRLRRKRPRPSYYTNNNNQN